VRLQHLVLTSSSPSWTMTWVSTTTTTSTTTSALRLVTRTVHRAPSVVVWFSGICGVVFRFTMTPMFASPVVRAMLVIVVREIRTFSVVFRFTMTPMFVSPVVRAMLVIDVR